MFQMSVCYYFQHACLLVCLSLLSVSQTSMDDSVHKGNTGQLLSSRVLGVRCKYYPYDSAQVSVCQSQSKLCQNSQFNLVLLHQTNVLGGNKLNCFKAMQEVLGGPTHILIWGSEIAKSTVLPDKLRGDLHCSLDIKGGPKFRVDL